MFKNHVGAKILTTVMLPSMSVIIYFTSAEHDTFVILFLLFYLFVFLVAGGRK